jgi:hypothetical protein
VKEVNSNSDQCGQAVHVNGKITATKAQDLLGKFYTQCPDMTVETRSDGRNNVDFYKVKVKLSQCLIIPLKSNGKYTYHILLLHSMCPHFAHKV